MRQSSCAHFLRCLRPESERWIQIHMLSSDTIARWLQTCVRKKPDEEGARRKREKTEERGKRRQSETERQREREERDKYPVLIHTRYISTECQFTGNLSGHVPISTDKYRFRIHAARFWWNNRSRILSDCIQNSFRFHSGSIHSLAPSIKSQ